MIFGIIHQCKKLEDLLISWTALRHGTVADWSSLFGFNTSGPCIKALEIQAKCLANPSAATKTENHFDNKVLESVSVDFANLTSLRFFGNSEFMSITDEDLIAISRTASNLRELRMSYISGPGLSPKGIGALVQSAQSGLEVLELRGCYQMEAERPEEHKGSSNVRLSRLAAQCPLLRRLWLQSVHTCRNIFACNDIAWSGKVQIGIGVNYSFEAPQLDEDTAVLYQVLDQARCFMDSRMGPGEKCVEIEILTKGFMFDPRCSLVHGDFLAAYAAREPWLVQKKKSPRKVQMTGYGNIFPFCINESEFKDGLAKG